MQTNFIEKLGQEIKTNPEDIRLLGFEISRTKEELAKKIDELTLLNTRLHKLQNAHLTNLYTNPDELIKLLTQLSKFDIRKSKTRPTTIMSLDFDETVSQHHIDLLSKRIKFHSAKYLITLGEHISTTPFQDVCKKYHLRWLCTAVYEFSKDQQDKILKEAGFNG